MAGVSIDVFSNKFMTNGLWNRLLDMHGGNNDLVIRWWNTPNQYPPFNLATPLSLMTDDSWTLVKDFIEARCQNSAADYDYGPMDYYSSKLDDNGNLLVKGKLPELRKAYHKYRAFGAWKRKTKKRFRDVKDPNEIV